jgi:hypothetical protein
MFVGLKLGLEADASLFFAEYFVDSRGGLVTRLVRPCEVVAGSVTWLPTGSGGGGLMTWRLGKT